MPFDFFQSVADLRSGWRTLHDIEKAGLVAAILAAGMRRRTLAKAVGCSEGSIRRLAVINAATAEEKDLARRGALSTNQLVKQVKSRREDQSRRHRQAKAAEERASAERAAKKILAWLNAELSPAYAEQIVNEVRLRFARTTPTGKPQKKAPSGMPLGEIIRRCGQAVPESADVNFIERYVRWLMLWTYYGFPDREFRDTALNLALSAVCRR